MPPFMRAPTDQDRLVEYTVNVIIDNSDTQGAPVLVEDTPTYKNLFGAIDRAVDPHSSQSTACIRSNCRSGQQSAVGSQQ
jgi:hypothetical protein